MTTDQSNATEPPVPATAEPARPGSSGPTEPSDPEGRAGSPTPDGGAPAAGAARADHAEDSNTTGKSAKDGKSASDDGGATDEGRAKDDAKGKSGENAKDGKNTKDTGETGNGKGDRTEVSPTDSTSADQPTDKWAAFGPAPEPVVGRIRRFFWRIGRGLVHEWTLASLASLVLAVLMTWPTLRYPLHTIPQDALDPTLQAWQLAWSGHILLTDPAQLWHSNTFYPEQWSFAFSDTLLGYAPAGMIGDGPVAAVLRYNILFVLAHALATFGAYALVRQLGAGRIGAAVAGVAYTYAPWLLAQAGHLHIISNGGIPLALAMLARGHGYSLRHGYRPERRHAGWAFAGWLVAAWQITLGFGIGVTFAYVLALIVLIAPVAWYIRRTWGRGAWRPFGWKLFLSDLAGGAIFAATGALLAIPYFKVADLHPGAERTLDQARAYAPPPTGFLTAPAESRIWGELHEQARAGLSWPPEMTLLPGFALYALALGGLFFSIWTVRQRLFLLAGVLATGILAMGPRFFGGTYTFNPLFEYLPGWNGVRTPGRLMLWTTLLLGILAAGAVTALAARARAVAAERVPPWPGPWLRLVTLLPLVLVLVEGLNVTPHPIVPTQPAAMRTVGGPILVLPSTQDIDQNVMLWSTSRFQKVVNGGSGFTPEKLDEIRKSTISFPDPASIEYLRTLGVRTVVLLRQHVTDTPWQSTIDQPVDHLGIQRENIGETVVYRL
ncbi:hypothetical protein GCM10027290_33830 [Micromonospora sonneratiae]|uniref:4-amino-4-deoxy-L-arabinose transferase n=1 Tax=Micromonospora sonneratiae TaxID=1184706 RepID=A0ABW3YGL4_9ACTN